MHLEKHFKFKDILALVVGSIVGSGVFYLAPKVFSITNSPGLAIMVWAFAGIITIAAGLTVAELAAAIPKTGGVIEYIRSGYGDLLSTICGWAFAGIIFPFYVVFLAAKFGQTVAAILGTSKGYSYIFFAILAVIFLTIANNFSALVGAKIQNFATIGKMIPLAVIILFGFYKGTISNSFIPILFPVIPHGLSGVSLFNVFTQAIIACIFAYDGWMFVGSVAGEMENPQKNLPKAIVLGILIVCVIYISINISYAISNPLNRLTDVAGIKNSGGIAAVTAQNLFPFLNKTLVRILINIGIMISVFGTLNGYMIFGSRIAYKMGSQRKFLFSRTISKLSKTSNVPHIGMLWVSILSIFFLLLDFLNPNVSGNLVELGTLGSWIFYILSFVAVIILRKTQPNLNRPYRVPMYPIIPILAIVGGLFAIYGGVLGDVPFFKGEIPIDFSKMQIPFATTGFFLIILGIPLHYIASKYYKSDEIIDEE